MATMPTGMADTPRFGLSQNRVKRVQWNWEARQVAQPVGGLHGGIGSPNIERANAHARNGPCDAAVATSIRP